MMWACDIGGWYVDYLADEVWLHRFVGGKSVKIGVISTGWNCLG